MLIIMAILLATLHGAAQTFGTIDIPSHYCAGSSDTIRFGMNSEFDVTIAPINTSISLSNQAFLPDGVECNGSCSYTSTITFNGFPSNTTITSVNDIKYIRLNMEHSYIGDIYIGITCPNNTKASLMNWSGGGNDSECANTVPSNHRGWNTNGSNTNKSTYFGVPIDDEDDLFPCNPSRYDNRPGVGWNYCWSNNTNSGYVYAGGNGSLIYRSANSNYTPTSSWYKTVDSSNVAAGTQFYKPNQNFSALIGCPLNGDWTIEVLDAWDQDNGYIFEWEMSVDPSLSPPQCGVDSALIISPYVEYLGDSTFAFNAPSDITDDTTIYLTLRIMNNCGDTIDSLVPIRVLTNRITDIYDTACDSYVWYGHTFTATTVAQVHLSRRHYTCDSLVNMHLQIYNSNDTSIIDTIVENELPYVNGSETLTASGIYTFDKTNSFGCDSSVTITLTVWPNQSVIIDTTLCRHMLPIQYNDRTLTTDEPLDTIVFNLLDIHGADSTVYLVLHILPDNETTITDTVVENELPVFECGLSWTRPVDTTIIFSNIYGCDSILHYSLTIWNNIEFVYDTTVCINYLPLTWNNQLFTADTTMTLNMLTVNGADSTVTLTLSTNPVYSIGIYTTICDNLLPYTYLDSTINQQPTNPTAYTFNLNTTEGCDSIITLNLTVLPTSDTTILDTVVQNDLPVFECGLEWMNSIDTTIIRSNIHSCDSTIHYTLTVWPNIVLTFDTTVCINQLPLMWKNQLIVSDTTMTLNMTTVNGADSIVTLTLNTNPVYHVNIDTTLCDNQMPLNYLDTTINLPQTKISTYTFNRNTIDGCDSIVTLNLTVLPTSDTTIYDTVVQNNLPHSFRDTLFNNSGSWQFHTINFVGCDSTIYYNLQVWVNDTTRLDTSVCSNHTPFIWHDVTFTNSNTAVVTHQNIHGADSVIILNASIPPAYDTSLAIDICDNEYYSLGRTHLTIAGHYDTTLFTRAHCDSVIHLDLMVYPTYDLHYYDTTCRTTAYTFIDAVYHESGDYTHNIPTSHGCDSLMTLHLALKGVNLKAAAQISPLIPTIENKHINLRDISQNAIDRLWIIDDLESHQRNLAIDYPEELDSLDAVLIAFSDDGCTDTVINTIRIDRSIIYAPNAFTPNQSDNAQWSLVGQQIATLEVWIYNREGLLVYHYEGVDGSWDGRSQNDGTNCQQGAYVYRADYTTLLHPSRKQSTTGTILLIR